MSAVVITPLALGRALRRWRLLHRVKQEHAAQIFGVAQSTISRWEAGRQAMEPTERTKLEAIVCARLDSAADRVLAALVNESPRPVHLLCEPRGGVPGACHGAHGQLIALLCNRRDPREGGISGQPGLV